MNKPTKKTIDKINNFYDVLEKERLKLDCCERDAREVREVMDDMKRILREQELLEGILKKKITDYINNDIKTQFNRYFKEEKIRNEKIYSIEHKIEELIDNYEKTNDSNLSVIKKYIKDCLKKVGVPQ
jgi:hypothetical protein